VPATVGRLVVLGHGGIATRQPHPRQVTAVLFRDALLEMLEAEHIEYEQLTSAA